MFTTKFLSSAACLWKLVETPNSTSSKLCGVCLRCISTEPSILTDKMGSLFLIGLNRPERRNAFNEEMLRRLAESFEIFERDDELRVAVVHGKGGNFSVGYDVDIPADCEAIKDLVKENTDMGQWAFSKPVIASITGYAMAAGFELACMCDLRVMEDTALMGVAGFIDGHHHKYSGVPMTNGGSARLPRLVGLPNALDILLTRRPIAGHEALRMGLVNLSIATGTALGNSVDLAYHVAKSCVLSDRRSAYYSAHGAASLKDAVDYEHKLPRRRVSERCDKIEDAS